MEQEVWKDSDTLYGIAYSNEGVPRTCAIVKNQDNTYSVRASTQSFKRYYFSSILFCFALDFKMEGPLCFECFYSYTFE